MAKTITFFLDPNNPPELTLEEIARMDAITDEQIEAAAAEEGPYTPEMEDSIRVIHAVRRARNATGLSQSKFAERYGFNVRTLQGWESGRFKPDTATQNYLRLIESDPDSVAKVIAAE